MSFTFHREYYHKVFRDALIDFYFPLMVKIFNKYYEELEEKGNKNDVNKFRELITEKVTEVKLNKEKVYSSVLDDIKDQEELKRLIKAININYIKMNTTDQMVTNVTKVNEVDLFVCVFIEVARVLYAHIYLFDNYNCCSEYEIYAKKAKVSSIIRKATKRGIKRCMMLNFIDKGVIDTTEIVVGNKHIPIDKIKMLEIFESLGMQEEANNIKQSVQISHLESTKISEPVPEPEQEPDVALSNKFAEWYETYNIYQLVF